jgi:hypothetical protein
MHEATIANGPVTQWLAIIGVVSLIYWGWRIGAALFKLGGENRAPREESKATAPAPPAARATAPTHENDIAVIAAAVFAVLGAHRIVHLEAEVHEQNWAFEGRWMQQTSHRPQA